MHILIAPNAFKNSLDAEAVADAIKEGLIKSNLDCTTEVFPVGDGGDGTGKLIIKKCEGVFIDTIVLDPLGRKRETTFGVIDEGRTAMIEMADASGLRLLMQEELNPLNALSYGTGQQIKIALDKGVKKIIIGMGGSATVDGGVGILKALGARFLNEQSEELPNLPNDLLQLERIDVSQLDKRIANTEVVVLCDVDINLLGKKGAADMFGPQKGASSNDIRTLDAMLKKLSEVAWKTTGKKMDSILYGGTAGGAAAGLYAFINAKLVSGIEYFLDLTKFETALDEADLVITGEGSIDGQTLQGKGPFGIARRAKAKGLPVIGLSGNVPSEKNEQLQKYFDVLLSIGNGPSDLNTALELARGGLSRTAHEIGKLLDIRLQIAKEQFSLINSKGHSQ